MARPRTYAPEDVMEEVKQAFWQGGYEGTSILDLERRTRLNRSSLYLGFGDKQALFAAALDRYVQTFIDPLLGEMEGEQAGLAKITAYFSNVKEILLADLELARRGCFLVNTFAEHRDPPNRALEAVQFWDRLRRAFGHALEGAAALGDTENDVIHQRASMLASVTLGVWLCARIDPSDAASSCDAINSEVDSWRLPSAT